jgi:antitoxin component YwqK of YwqJK toxin-antitoxin module
MFITMFFFRRFIAFCITVLVVLPTFGQENKKDANGKKQGYWLVKGKHRASSGIRSEGKVEEGNYVNDRKTGLWVKYHKDGKTPKLKGTYRNNRPDGKYTRYYSNGIVKEIGTFSQNKNVDSLKRYHENGKLAYEAKLDGTGKETGEVRYFHPNGNIAFQYAAANGVPEGKATRYFENGEVQSTMNYANGGKVTSSRQFEASKPIDNPIAPSQTSAKGETAPKIVNPRTKGARFQPNGYNKVYNANDEIWQDGDFKNGLLWDGKVYEYDRDGILLKVKVFKNGVYHSDGQL